jgi:hypothetical protein
MITITDTDPRPLGTSSFTPAYGKVQYNAYHWTEMHGMAFVGMKSDLETLGLPVGQPIQVGDQFYDINIDVQFEDTPRVITLYAKEKRHVLRVAQVVSGKAERRVYVIAMARILVQFDEHGWRVGPVRTLDEFYIDLPQEDLDYTTFDESMIPTLR